MTTLTEKRLAMADAAGVKVTQIEGAILGNLLVTGFDNRTGYPIYWHPDQDLNQLAIVIESVRPKNRDVVTFVGDLIHGYLEGSPESENPVDLRLALFEMVYIYIT